VYGLVDRWTIYLPNCADKKENAYGVATRSHSASLDGMYINEIRERRVFPVTEAHIFSPISSRPGSRRRDGLSPSLSLSLSLSLGQRPLVRWNDGG